jgi:hypothetical protein
MHHGTHRCAGACAGASGPPLIAPIAPCVAVAPPLDDIALCERRASQITRRRAAPNEAAVQRSEEESGVSVAITMSCPPQRHRAVALARGPPPADLVSAEPRMERGCVPGVCESRQWQRLRTGCGYRH